jgi:hypothetical protein
MVVDDLLDLQESFVPMWMRGWRCIACGNIVDPLILRHRLAQSVGKRRPTGLKAGMSMSGGPVRGRVGSGV